MSDNPFSLWVYLSQSPLLWLTVTLLTYACADAVSLRTHRHPLANPVLHSMWIIGAFLLLTGTLHDLFRRRAVRAFPVGPRHRGARRPIV